MTEWRPAQGPNRGIGRLDESAFTPQYECMTLRLATWNVNSLRQRLDHLARFVAEAQPDVVCLQETKVTDELFPTEAVRALGYPHLLVHGQKGYNGVAIRSCSSPAPR